MSETFSVCQFFKEGGHEYVKRHVDGKEAVETFRHYTQSVAAQIGVVVRVIITDDGDMTNMEWKFGEGLTYPPELVSRWNGKVDPVELRSENFKGYFIRELLTGEVTVEKDGKVILRSNSFEAAKIAISNGGQL